MILNLTQHAPTAEQSAVGVTEPKDKARVQLLLTFEELPNPGEIHERARALADLAVEYGAESAMIGGAPFFMGSLEAALRKNGVLPVHAFSRRESTEEPDGQGGVRKTQVFRHVGFVAA